jgi:hypothetical protein
MLSKTLLQTRIKCCINYFMRYLLPAMKKVKKYSYLYLNFISII